MSYAISDECKQKIKEIEDELLWAITIIEGSPLPYAVIPEIISFMAISCRFHARVADEDCKNLMSGWEDEFLNLRFSTSAKQMSGFEAILESVRISKGH